VAPSPNRSRAGFSIIELLIVLVIIGVITGITLPTLLNCLDRGRQMKTVADLRTIGGAVEAYALDFSVYPSTNDPVDLAVMLQSEYMRRLVSGDGWHNTWLIDVGATSYTLASAGKDGSGSLIPVGGGGPTQGFNADIIFANGAFAQWPEGTQHEGN